MCTLIRLATVDRAQIKVDLVEVERRAAELQALLDAYWAERGGRPAVNTLLTRGR